MRDVLMGVGIVFLFLSIVTLACGRFVPKTALGRCARRMLACSVSLRWRGKIWLAITGRQMAFVGIGWKVIAVLCLLGFFILQTCQQQSAILGASFVELPFFARMRYCLVMILMDGKAAAQKIFDELKREAAGMEKKPRLAVVVVGRDPVVDAFIAQKKKAGEPVGIDVRVYPFPADITTNTLRKRISEIVHEKKNTGVIIQLPLPAHINKQYILNAIPPEKDPDVLSSRAVGSFAVGKNPIMPPVAGAIKTLFEEYKIDYRTKSIVIVGAGVLVGRPVALWLLGEGVGFTLITESTSHAEAMVREADIVISGIGKPRYIGDKMIKQGAVVVDAGASESAGQITGDVDADSVAGKAGVLAAVPGGVGPLTVAILFKNLLTLARV